MISEFQNEYRWLSNMHFCYITYKGKVWKSVEHAYMAAKAPDDVAWQTRCLTDNKIGRIKRDSKRVKLRDDWNTVKLEVMWELLWLKYTRPTFRAQLLATGDMHIAEGNAWGDTFWGVDKYTGEGKNTLGVYIMAIREHLKPR